MGLGVWGSCLLFLDDGATGFRILGFRVLGLGVWGSCLLRWDDGATGFRILGLELEVILPAALGVHSTTMMMTRFQTVLML